jgi:HK97 family phage portal protein
MFNRFLNFFKADEKPAVRRWLYPEAEAERWQMPDPAVYGNQADLYRKLSYIGTVVDIVANACVNADFDIINTADGQEDDNHPLAKLLDRPNPFDSRTEFIRAHYAWRMVSGNSYWFLNRASANVPPDEIWILPPSKIIPVPDGTMGLRGYLYTPGNGAEIPLEPWEVCHFKSFNPSSRYLGLSAIESLAMTSYGAIAAQEWNTRLFADNNARLPGILAFAEMIQDGDWQKMKAEVADSAKKRNQMMLRGVGDRGVNWIQGTATQREMEFLEGLDRSMREIYDRLAPGLYNMLTANSSLANGETGMSAFGKFTVSPLLRETTDKLNSELLPAYGDGYKAEYEEIVPEDKAAKMAEIEQFAKFHTVDEVRVEMFGNDPDPDKERGKLFVQQITAAKSEPVTPPAPDVIPVIPEPDEVPEMEDEPEEEEIPEPEPTAEVKADLDRWRRKALRTVGTPEAVIFTSDYIPAEMNDNISAALSSCKCAADVIAVFGNVKAQPITTQPDNTEAIKSLAAMLERAIETATKAEVITMPPMPVYNMTMPAITLNAQMPANGSVTVNVPEQPAPIVNITTPEPVVNVAAAVNNITVQPAEVNIPNMPTEAEIYTKPNGTRVLKVK